jgi:tRNA A-37 threonylcarbamoyl transferase component Bud32
LDLPRTGSLVKDRGHRQIWRFEHADRAYYLKFYPRIFSFSRLIHGSLALQEFLRLQALQRSAIPAPRAVAVLMGFRLNEQLGDAVIIDAIEPSIQLDLYLHQLELAGDPIPRRHELSAKVCELVHALARARLGHSDLHLGNFLLKDADGELKVYLLDGYAVTRGGLRRSHLFQLGHSVARYATATDLQRGWDLFGDRGPLPRRNPVSSRIWSSFMQRITSEDDYFGLLGLEAGRGWSGVFFKQYKYPYRWSAISQLQITREDWAAQWPSLLAQIESDSLPILKRTRSGDVLTAELTLGGRPVSVIIKRPRRRRWYRYINEIGRGGRARRAWYKSWRLVIRNLPAAWPVLLMENRKFGYMTDAIVIFERVPGPTLATADLDALPSPARDMLFRRTGRLLRRIDQLGFAHFDAKASNWIVFTDPHRGPMPVLIDPDGIRRRRWLALGIRRLLRSMQEHPQYTIPDSLALAQGYAPRARMFKPEDEHSESPDSSSPLKT